MCRFVEHRTQQGIATFGDAAIMVGLMLCVRYLSDWMVQYPVAFGTLIIGSLATFVYGFYVTFFSGGKALTLGDLDSGSVQLRY